MLHSAVFVLVLFNPFLFILYLVTKVAENVKHGFVMKWKPGNKTEA
jgi:hypothetical protein